MPNKTLKLRSSFFFPPETILEIAPITLLYGLNGAGKTVVMREIAKTEKQNIEREVTSFYRDEEPEALLRIVKGIASCASQLIGIEFPEAHLHPGSQYKIVQILTHLSKNVLQKKGISLIIETHSKNIVSGFLTFVATKLLTPQDVIGYHIKREIQGIIITKCPVNDKGQIVGGLDPFCEEQIENI